MARLPRPLPSLLLVWTIVRQTLLVTGGTPRPLVLRTRWPRASRWFLAIRLRSRLLPSRLLLPAPKAGLRRPLLPQLLPLLLRLLPLRPPLSLLRLLTVMVSKRFLLHAAAAAVETSRVSVVADTAAVVAPVARAVAVAVTVVTAAMDTVAVVDTVAAVAVTTTRLNPRSKFPDIATFGLLTRAKTVNPRRIRLLTRKRGRFWYALLPTILLLDGLMCDSILSI